MFRKVLYSFVIIILIFFTAGYFLPREAHVERTIQIDRPAPTVFALVNGFATFMHWAPWTDQDPSMTYTLSGPMAGTGARMNWSGDPRLTGSGWQEIVASEPYRRVRSRLNFDNEAEATASFILEERPGGTRVTWGFDTDLTAGQSLLTGIVLRYFGLFFDRWIGADFEHGLANLKAFAEGLPNVDISDLEVDILHVEPVEILYIETGSNTETENITSTLAAAYRQIMDFINERGLERVAQPLAITRMSGQSGYAFDAAIPVRLDGVAPEGPVKAGLSPSGPAIRAIHRGAYDRMMPTYEKLSAYMAAHGLREGPVSWEQYVSDPGITPEDELITHIYFQLADQNPDVRAE